MSITPPQAPPSWNHSAEEIISLTKQAIDKHKAVDDKVGALAASDCTWESVFLPLAYSETDLDAVVEPLSFYQNVSPSKELRDASNEAEVLVRDYGVEASMRLDVFQAKVSAEKNIKESGQWDKLSAEDQRLIEKMAYGKRAGLALPEAERAQLTTLKKELSQACLEFSKNFNEENGTIAFTEDELKGVPKDVVSGYKKRTEDGKDLYDVTFKTPDIFPVFKFAENPETRKRAQEAHESRLAINVPLLSKALELRRQIATLLGYDTWADYITEVKMIKSSKGVNDFLADLESKLRPVGIKERETLLGLKKKEHEEKGFPFDGEFYLWDYRYYDRLYIEKSLDLDDSLVKEYFPVSVVVPTILDIYQNLLGVRFEELKDTSTWHTDVQHFAVWQKDAKDESGFVGYCYLDLFPREAKYSHAAVWPLLAGHDLPDGKRSYPLTAMVANLAKSTPDKPALMRHDDVVTFFHEMGHVFHGLLSQTKFARFHGTSRYVNVGLFYLRQLFFAMYDIKMTDITSTLTESSDYTALWNNLREKISLVKADKPSPGQGTFGHITGGYDAGYYGYTYSLVFAADMYSTVFKADPLDPARGTRYSQEILKPGGSREELDSLQAFLGRPPNSDAFLKELFGTTASHL
ncbi:hypothetical protein ONZ45_g3985 [Pleurotus djamor]|nr:hypothetical protein ONZ45_g3985 [Pleurotus djamor]